MANAHFSPEDLSDRFEFKQRFKNVAFGLIGVGLVLIILGALFGGSHGHGDSHAEGQEHAALAPSGDVHAVVDMDQVPEDQGDEHGDSHAEDQADHGTGHADTDSHADETHGESHGEAHADGHGDDHGEAHAGGHGGEHGDGHAGGHHHKEPTMFTRIASNLLICGLYFLTLSMGALFFLAIHKVGNAGWHIAVRRVPEAITSGYLPFGVIIMGAVFFFMGELYEWVNIEPGTDAIIDAKRGYLNQPFWIIRSVLFFGVWTLVAIYIRRQSLLQDQEGGLTHFGREQKISAFFVVFFAISYSLFAVDWIKSLEPHWFSTIFFVYIFAGSMVSAMITIYLIVSFLKQQGHMSYVNDAHLHDLGKYTFGFSVFWAYIWVAQYLLIWYSNIPEEGIYYVKRYRVEDSAYLGYSFMFYANLFINFITPFLVLMTRNAKRKLATFLPLAMVVLYGHWHDLYLMVMPGAMGENPGLGVVEVGFLGWVAGVGSDR
ncbi:MAG: hypothetical protein AAF804_07245, partial [Bacteroidota bacterium]